MLKLALLGRDISHSKSQQMYEDLLGEKVRYELLDFEKADAIPRIEEVLEGLDGLSITSPYKKHFLDSVEMSPEVESLGAINCISKQNGRYFATNTDFLAVKEIFKERYLSKDIIVLGDGVMAKITLKVLNDLGLGYKQYSRKKDGNLNNLVLLGDNTLVVNTCSRNFVFNNELSPGSIFWDYNYSFPAHVEFFRGTSTLYIDGLEMLKLQAKHALKFWRK
ncbi:hypothetical protein [Halobacteriovorax sp. JY17]|uniref:shikimate dehydrogenase family protein n=1 Tax=Halobacteriovorax sp. JY17 TaxID=2014617 RepID=UPI000C5007CC|nr:hypothetical protein [Halobacteriovorax sp. JY17]PIK14468.1 MAG: hypothetical protein CES88_08985 [Halobacteriovorax sp. JY17]